MVAMLFRLEACRKAEQIPMRVGELMASLGSDDRDSLRRAFQIWLSKVFFPRWRQGMGIVNHLWDDQTMLAERVREWEAEWLRQGIEKGLQQGLAEGRQKGEAALLRRQLMKRFGELPRSVSDRLGVAQPEQIECWGERVLDARSLSEVFDF